MNRGQTETIKFITRWLLTLKKKFHTRPETFSMICIACMTCYYRTARMSTHTRWTCWNWVNVITGQPECQHIQDGHAETAWMLLLHCNFQNPVPTTPTTASSAEVPSCSRCMWENFFTHKIWLSEVSQKNREHPQNIFGVSKYSWTWQWH